jgi:hypothetical protein
MTRLIDADALLEKFAKLEAIALEYVGKLNERKDPNEHDMWMMWTGILNERTAYKYEIIDAPTVDAVPVIRCKDCVNCGTDDCAMHFEIDDKVYQWNRADDFCSLGERKEHEID